MTKHDLNKLPMEQLRAYFAWLMPWLKDPDRRQKARERPKEAKR